MMAMCNDGGGTVNGPVIMRMGDDTVVWGLRQSLTAVYPRGLYVTRGMIRVT